MSFAFDWNDNDADNKQDGEFEKRLCQTWTNHTTHSIMYKCVLFKLNIASGIEIVIDTSENK